MPIMAKSNDEYTEVKAIKTPDGTEIDYVLSKVDNTYKRTYTATRELEDTPPLEFKSIKPNANLTNYRIYGQTVDGESVGDRTGNLFYKKIENANIASNDGRIYSAEKFNLWIGKVKAGETYTSYNTNSIVGFFTDEPDYGAYTYDNSRITNATSVFTFTVPNGCSYVGVRILKNDPTAMLNVGSTDLPYEPYGYRIPITNNSETANIYLDEPLRKVGDEAEYVDYATQKWHRVRKNLLQNTATSQTINGVTFTVNADGSVTCNGTATDTARINVSAEPSIFNDVILTGCPVGGDWFTFQFDILQATSPHSVLYRDVGSGVRVDTGNIEVYCRIRIASGYTCDNLTFYPMIRLATIDDDTYEPYIENTDLDVTLPALPTVTGTNVLSVGTEVQPSDMYIKGNFKMIAGGGE